MPRALRRTTLPSGPTATVTRLEALLRARTTTLVVPAVVAVGVTSSAVASVGPISVTDRTTAVADRGTPCTPATCRGRASPGPSGVRVSRVSSSRTGVRGT